MGSMKIKLGMTPEEIEAQEAQKEREREEKIHEAAVEQRNKIIDMHRAQKRKVTLFLVIAGVIIFGMFGFGIYGVFFKHTLNLTDVRTQINRQVNVYPMGGLDNYIRDNCEAMFYNYVINQPNNGYEWIDIDEDSVSLSRVRPVNNTLAEVWFCADVVTKLPDTQVTDQAIIDRLHRNGFADIVEEPVEEPTIEVEAIDYSTWEIDEGSGLPIEPTTGLLYDVESGMVYVLNTDQLITIEEARAQAGIVVEEPVEETEPEEEENPEADDTELGNISLANDRYSDPTEYYVLGNGTIMQRGETVTNRYTFYVPIEYYYNYDNGEAVTSGYRPAAALSLYNLVDVNQTNFNSISINPSYAFNYSDETRGINIDIAPVDENTLNSARIKVNNILDALYSGRDTSQDFFNYRQFNTYGATYINMVSFSMYEEPNAMGYNAFVQYVIETPQGFQYQINAYMMVEPVGEGQSRTWKITAMT